MSDSCLIETRVAILDDFVNCHILLTNIHPIFQTTIDHIRNLPPLHLTSLPGGTWRSSSILISISLLNFQHCVQFLICFHLSASMTSIVFRFSRYLYESTPINSATAASQEFFVAKSMGAHALKTHHIVELMYALTKLKPCQSSNGVCYFSCRRNYQYFENISLVNYTVVFQAYFH